MILKSTSMIENTQFSSIKSTSLETASASSLIISGVGGMSQSSTNEGFVMSTTDAVPAAGGVALSTLSDVAKWVDSVRRVVNARGARVVAVA